MLWTFVFHGYFVHRSIEASRKFLKVREQYLDIHRAGGRASGGAAAGSADRAPGRSARGRSARDDWWRVVMELDSQHLVRGVDKIDMEVGKQETESLSQVNVLHRVVTGNWRDLASTVRRASSTAYAPMPDGEDARRPTLAA